MPNRRKYGRRSNPQTHNKSPNRCQASYAPLAGGPSHHHVLTMAEEAHNTDRHSRVSRSDHRLRNTTVSFVSAGTLHNSETDKSEVVEDSEELEVPRHAMELMHLSPPFRNSVSEVQVLTESHRSHEVGQISDPGKADRQLHKVKNRQGSSATCSAPTPCAQRSEASPTPSNSSEEVILFRGRASQVGTARPIGQRIRSIDEKIQEKEELLNSLQERKFSASSELSPKILRQGFGPRKESFRQKSNRRSEARERKVYEDSIVADYIANIDRDDDSVDSADVTQRELEDAHGSTWQARLDKFSTGFNSNATTALEDAGDYSYVSDFDAMNPPDEIIGDVQAVLSKRHRKAGVQYLIVWEGKSHDQAIWVPAISLQSCSATTLIGSFEAEARLRAQIEVEDDSSNASCIDDNMALEDENDLLQRKVERMTDEEIARLVSKQEELGIRSDGIVLFDGYLGTDDLDCHASSRPNSRSVKISSAERTIRGKCGRGRLAEFQSASALADAYDGFDIMDFDRPSLNKKPKGRRGKLMLELTDSELDASMETAWKNDRLKKKERKEQRETLRQQGLLSKKGAKPELRQKYKEGMGIDAVKDEIKRFLMSENTTLALPPMAKADRKIIHDLANAFNLKSKSAGNGNRRFPVLYRTQRTSSYADHVFDAVEARLKRRYLPRMDMKGRSGRLDRSINNAAFSYRDGDVVGASAPVLGVENRGRAMLEKMGWSSGTALGALNNKGILEPVSHVVKTSKAGLG